MTAAALIRDARRVAGLTQDELAKRAGTSQPAIARYERGAASPSVATLDRILRAAGQRLVLGAQATGSQHVASTARMRGLRTQRREALALIRAHGARNPRVFGSTARGEDRPDSDIDVVVDFDFDERGIFPLIDLREALSALLGEQVDLVGSDLLKPEVLEAIERDGVAL